MTHDKRGEGRGLSAPQKKNKKGDHHRSYHRNGRGKNKPTSVELGAHAAARFGRADAVDVLGLAAGLRGALFREPLAASVFLRLALLRQAPVVVVDAEAQRRRRGRRRGRVVLVAGAARASTSRAGVLSTFASALSNVSIRRSCVRDLRRTRGKPPQASSSGYSIIRLDPGQLFQATSQLSKHTRVRQAPASCKKPSPRPDRLSFDRPNRAIRSTGALA